MFCRFLFFFLCVCVVFFFFLEGGWVFLFFSQWSQVVTGPEGAWGSLNFIFQTNPFPLHCTSSLWNHHWLKAALSGLNVSTHHLSDLPALAWKNCFPEKESWWQFPVIEFPVNSRGWVRARQEPGALPPLHMEGCTEQSVLCPPVPKVVFLAPLSQAAGAGCITTPGKSKSCQCALAQCPSGITGL